MRSAPRLSMSSRFGNVHVVIGTDGFVRLLIQKKVIREVSKKYIQRLCYGRFELWRAMGLQLSRLITTLQRPA